MWVEGPIMWLDMAGIWRHGGYDRSQGWSWLLDYMVGLQKWVGCVGALQKWVGSGTGPNQSSQPHSKPASQPQQLSGALGSPCHCAEGTGDKGREVRE